MLAKDRVFVCSSGVTSAQQVVREVDMVLAFVFVGFRIFPLVRHNVMISHATFWVTRAVVLLCEHNGTTGRRPDRASAPLDIVSSLFFPVVAAYALRAPENVIRVVLRH